MKIFVDVDGVVADLMPEWISLYNKEFGDCLTEDGVLGWSLHDYVKPECGKQIYKYLHLPDLYHGVKPIPGALEGIQALREAGHRVIFATSTNKHQAGKKLDWLASHGFLTLRHGTNSLDYVEIQDKSLLRGDLIIDDGLHNLQGFVGQKILFHASHNDFDREYFRARDWDAVIRCVVPGSR